MRALMVITVLLTLVCSAYSGPSDDEFEPNDTCEEATPNVVTAGEECSLYLEVNNEDWFEFDIPEGGLLTIQTAKGFTLPYMSNTIIEVFAEGCEELIAFNDDINFSSGNYYSAVYLDLVPNTTVYIRIRSGDPELPAGSYRLECFHGTVESGLRTWSQVKTLFR